MTKNKHILLLLITLLVSVVMQDACAQQMPAEYIQGRSLYNEGRYEEAAASFTKALSQLGVQKGAWVSDSAQEVISKLNVCYSQARKNNISFKKLDFDSSITEESNFHITKVFSSSDDSAVVTINEGWQDGIFQDAKAWVWASNSASNGDTTRAYRYLGAARIVSLTADNCTLVLHFYKSRKGWNVLPKDVVEIHTHPIRDTKKDLLYNLMRGGVVFNDNNNEILIDRRIVFNNTDTNLIHFAMESYAREVRAFAIDLDGLDDKQFSTPATTGPFKGRTLKQVFHVMTSYDIFAFFNFVNTYKGKYIGVKWKINETFATWVINNCPSGDNDRVWLIPAAERATIGGLEKFVEQTAYYITNDTLYTWDNTIRNYIQDGNNEAAELLLAKALYFAEYLDDRPAKAALHFRKSFMKRAAKDHKAALNEMLYSYSLYPQSDNYAWQVAIMYADAERYDSAFVIFDTLVRRYPDNWEIKGNYGWYKTLAGRFDEAAPLCKYAYDNNPYSASCAVNYGHVFLLQGKLDSAKYYYSKMLANLTTPEEYLDGPKKDFEILFAKGWQRTTVADIAEWLDNEFKKTYQYTTAGTELWKDAKQLYKDHKNKKAIVKFQEYINTLSNLAQPDMASIYNAVMYVGHCYYRMGQRDSAIKKYTLCLDIAKTHLANRRGKQADDDFIALAYERLHDYYKDTMNDAQTAATYKMLYNAEVMKLADLNNAAHLHIICLGGSDTLTNSPFAKNSKIFFDSLVALGNAKDTAATHIYLSGSILNRKNLLDKLSDIRHRSKPEDIFIFYYSGHTVTINDREMLCFNFADTENGCIDAKELLQNIDQVYAKKKMVITDDPEPQLFGLISSQYTSANASANEIIFFCPAVKTPVTKEGYSMFTNELVNGLSELKKRDKFSAKEFIDKASYALGRGEHYLPVLNFSYGRDFVLYKTDSIIAAERVQTRGLSIRGLNDDEGAGTPSGGGAQKNYALFFADNIYDDNNTWHNLSNPISDATALAQLLEEDFGFQVEVIRNANKKEIENKLREYRNRSYGPNDQLMIFFAGHGIYYPDANMGYLVAKDSKEPSQADPNFNTYLSYSDLGNLYLKNMKCRRIFLVLDACYAGSFFEEKGYHRGADMFGNDKSAQQRLNMLKKNASGKSYYKGISSGGKETVEDGKKDQHSPFAGGLLAMLNSAIASQYVTADAIIGEIQNYHPGNTTPSSGTFNYSDPQGLFIFEAKTEQKANFKTDHLR